MSELTSTELLRVEVENLEKLLAKKKRLLTEAEQIDGMDSQKSGLIIRNNEFAHMELKDAVVKYLQMSGKARATLVEMLPILREGGADLGKQKERHPRNLKIAVRMNSRTSSHPLVYDADTETVSLRHAKEKQTKQTA